VSRTVRTRVIRWRGAEPIESSDELAAEEPLEIRIAGEPITVTMRTPGHDLELVAGMLVAENLIDIATRPVMRKDHPNVVNVALAGGDRSRVEAMRHTSVMSASCGLCGKASIESLHQNFPPVDDDVTITADLVQQMVRVLGAAQKTFELTGGLHGAGIFDRAGNLIVAREDIGRHNAVDKAVGYALLRRLLPLHGCTLVVSGRASFEIVQKALGARVPVIAAVSAPSSLAVDLASESGQTLLGFVREGRCNVYTHPERIASDVYYNPPA
jgi:FdhD protein